MTGDALAKVAGRTSRQRIDTAYHEAGHVAAAWFLGIPVKSATIKPDETTWGHVVTYRSQRWRDWHMERLTAYREGIILRHLQVSSAGIAAAAKHLGRRNWRGFQGDFRDIVDDAFSLLGADGEEAEALLQWLLLRGRKIIETEHVWAVVEAITQALLERTTLDAAEIDVIIREALASHSTALRRVGAGQNEQALENDSTTFSKQQSSAT